MVHEDLGSPQTALAVIFLTDVLLFLAPRAQALPGHREPLQDSRIVSHSYSRAVRFLKQGPLSPAPSPHSLQCGKAAPGSDGSVNSALMIQAEQDSGTLQKKSLLIFH